MTSSQSERGDVVEDYRAQGDTLTRLIGHGIEALCDGDGDATTARVTLANLEQLSIRYRGAVDALAELVAAHDDAYASALSGSGRSPQAIERLAKAIKTARAIIGGR